MSVAAPPRRLLRTREAEALIEEARRRQRRRHVRVAALALAAVALGLAAYAIFAVAAHSSGAGGGGGGAAAAAPRTQVVVVLVDVSGSMAATDVAPTRLDATRHAIRLFLAKLSPGVKVGLVAFSNDVEVLSRPTANRAAVVAALASLTPEKGTAMGAGLVQAVDLSTSTLARMGVERSHGVLPAAVVLVSDGAQNLGAVTPAEAAKRAAAAGITVDGIALGTKGGAVSFGGGPQGATIRVAVPPYPRGVRLVTGIARGTTFLAPNAAALDSAFSRLASAFNR